MASFNGRHLTAFLKENLLQYCCSTIGLHLPPSFTFFLQDFFIFFAKRQGQKRQMGKVKWIKYLLFFHSAHPARF